MFICINHHNKTFSMMLCIKQIILVHFEWTFPCWLLLKVSSRSHAHALLLITHHFYWLNMWGSGRKKDDWLELNEEWDKINNYNKKAKSNKSLRLHLNFFPIWCGVCPIFTAQITLQGTERFLNSLIFWFFTLNFWSS